MVQALKGILGRIAEMIDIMENNSYCKVKRLAEDIEGWKPI